MKLCILAFSKLTPTTHAGVAAVTTTAESIGSGVSHKHQARRRRLRALLGRNDVNELFSTFTLALVDSRRKEAT